MDEDFLSLQRALLGRYSIERPLGRGGMGIVYLARDILLERPVAIKVLPPDFVSTEDLRRRFLREARTAASLQHPNVIPIHAVEELEDSIIIVMTFVDGGTLSNRVREQGPLPPAEVANWPSRACCVERNTLYSGDDSVVPAQGAEAVL